MATVTTLKDNLYEIILLINGTTQETNTKIVDASTLTYALPSLSFYHLPVREVAWSTVSTNTITLTWEGTPNLPFLYLSGSGILELSDKIATKIKNTATSATGDILLSTSSASPYSVILVLEKALGSYDKTEKYNF